MSQQSAQSTCPRFPLTGNSSCHWPRDLSVPVRRHYKAARLGSTRTPLSSYPFSFPHPLIYTVNPDKPVWARNKVIWNLIGVFGLLKAWGGRLKNVDKCEQDISMSIAQVVKWYNVSFYYMRGEEFCPWLILKKGFKLYRQLVLLYLRKKDSV